MPKWDSVLTLAKITVVRPRETKVYGEGSGVSWEEPGENVSNNHLKYFPWCFRDRTRKLFSMRMKWLMMPWSGGFLPSFWREVPR